MIYVGMDAGSRWLKIVLWDGGKRRQIAAGLAEQGTDCQAVAAGLLRKLLRAHRFHECDIGRVVATGYGRNLIRMADTTITEITCHARGVNRLAPAARTVVEIGGQDSKLLRLEPDGRVRDFAMNDRCAAGTGRFLEVVAGRLKISVKKLGSLVHRGIKPAPISSMCIVFAETEILGLLAGGVPPANIVAGVQQSIAVRVAGMTGSILEQPVVFTGGVALVSGMKEALAKVLKCPVSVAPQPQFTGALGAALLAADSPTERNDSGTGALRKI
ncbi:MAG: acyl-CoA dehydratase activase [Verrucomicrobiae bacterium]|nr:acyl-CoA dehydratase activase [Verrucomicrobiae bacterium]